MQRDDFLTRSLRRLSASSPPEQKEIIEALILFNQIYNIPQAVRHDIVIKVLPLLESASTSLRYWLARLLGEYGCPEALPNLQHAIQTEKDPFARQWLEGAFNHLSCATPTWILKRLGSTEPEARIEAAAAAFLESDPMVRSLISEAIRCERNEEALAWLLLSLPGPEHMRRRARLLPIPVGPRRAIDIPTGASPLIEAHSEDLLIRLLDVKADRVTEFAIWNLALNRCTTAAAVVSRLLSESRHPRANVREWAYKYLGFVLVDGSLELLARGLKVETDGEAREGIAFALGSLNSVPAAELLRDMLHGDAHVGARRCAARALGTMDVDRRLTAATLSATLELETNPDVVHEIYSALALNPSPWSLRALPILAAHAASPIYREDVLTLVIAAVHHASHIDVSRHIAKLDLLKRSSDIVDAGYALAKELGVQASLIICGPTGVTAHDAYQASLKKLVMAGAQYGQDPSWADAEVREVLAELSALRISVGTFGTLIDYPLLDYISFYIGVCQAHIDIGGAIESRLNGDLDDSSGRFETGRAFFALHQEDSALLPTERSLCAGASLWAAAQIGFNQAGRPENRRMEPLDLVALVNAATARAREALRPAFADLLARLRRSARGLRRGSPIRTLYQRRSVINRRLLLLPISFDRPFEALAVASMRIRSVQESARGTVLEVELSVDPEKLRQFGRTFDFALAVRYRSSERYQVLRLARSDLFSGSQSSKTVAIPLSGRLDNTSALEFLLRFEHFDWPVGPVAVPATLTTNAAERPKIDAAELRTRITNRYDLEELRALCQDLGVDYDDLRGEGKAPKARELVSLMARQGRLQALLDRVTSSPEPRAPE